MGSSEFVFQLDDNENRNNHDEIHTDLEAISSESSKLLRILSLAAPTRTSLTEQLSQLKFPSVTKRLTETNIETNRVG